MSTFSDIHFECVSEHTPPKTTGQPDTTILPSNKNDVIMNGAEAASAPNNPLDVMMEAVEKKTGSGNNTEEEPTLEGETDENNNNNSNGDHAGGDAVMGEASETADNSTSNKSVEGGEDNDMEDASSAAVSAVETSEGGGDDDVMDDASSAAEVTKENDDSASKKSDAEKKKENDNTAAATDGGETKADEPPPNYPLLVGTLSYVDKDNLRRHVIRGNWKYEHTAETAAPMRFELLRNIPPEEDVTQLPMDGEFNGSFSLQYAFKNTKGKLKLKNRTVPESGVAMTFKEDKDNEGEYSVNGKGTNEFGVFELFGTATKASPAPGEEDVKEYKIKVRKRYISLADPPALEEKKEKKSKDKKRKLGDAVDISNPAELPPPTILHPTGVICLRGKLIRHTSADLSLDNTFIHRIKGVWAMGLDKILADPDNTKGECNKFEYEHKCSGDSTVFPLSGRYTGSFYVNADANNKTKVAEKDVILKFHKNNEGYHNVEGKGSNYYGKYIISGTLDKEGTITIFRNFQAPKVKASKKNTAATQVVSTPEPGPLNGASSASISSTAAGPSISLDDVKAPVAGSGPIPMIDPPRDYAAVMRGILKIESDGTHTCSGNWAVTNDHFQSGITSKYHFGIEGHRAADDAKLMLERMKESGANKDDDRELKGLTGDGVTPFTLANTTFPIDSPLYKGTFKLRKGTTKHQTIMDKQIAMKFVKNDAGSYNVYGRGVNEFGEFNLVGNLILQGKAHGHIQVYRIYEQPPQPVVVQPASKKGGKVFPGGMTEKAGNSGPVPAMKPAERFTPSMSGLQRRESSGRSLKVPPRLEEDDPQAIMDRLMEQCRQILKELQAKDLHSIFAAPVDPVALNIPNYLEIIKEPMDLGTIENRMNVNVIESPEEFARLVRLTFTNAIKYNSMPDNPVHQAARTMLTIFNSRFGTIDKTFEDAKKNRKLTKAERQEMKRKEKEAAKEAKKKAKEEKERKRKAAEDAANESKRMKIENFINDNNATMGAIRAAADSSGKVSRNEFNLLLDMVQRMQDHVVGLHKLVNNKSGGGKSQSSASSKKSQEKAVPKPTSATVLIDAPMYDDEPPVEDYDSDYGEPVKPKKKKAKKEPQAVPVPEKVADLSFEEQTALSQAINELPERLLIGAMQIIREADVGYDDDDEEIDLEIDQLDSRTQRKLQKFVQEVRLVLLVRNQ